VSICLIAGLLFK